MIERIAPVAALLDAQDGGSAFADSLAVQKDKLLHPEHTPSARVLRKIQAHGGSFIAFATAQSAVLAKAFRARPLDAEQQSAFEKSAETSRIEQAEMERKQTGSFDEFIEDYRSRTSQQICCDE